MTFSCSACGAEHLAAGEHCEPCDRFIGALEGLLDQYEDPLPALKQFCQDEFDWVVFDGEEEYEQDCVDRMRDLRDEGIGL